MSSDKPTLSRPTRSFTARSLITKRDSLTAELERDPKHSSSKRQARTAALASHLTHASSEREVLTLRSAKAELEAKLREKEVIIERLERDRRWLSEREQEERDAKEQAERNAEDQKRNADEQIRTLRRTLSVLREEHVDLQELHSSFQLSSEQRLSAQESEIVTLSRQISLFTTSLDNSKKIVAERDATISTLRGQLDELSSRQNNASDDAKDDNWAIVRDELHRQASYLRQLELTNAKLTTELHILRERHASIEVLKEEKANLERKVTSLEEFRTKFLRAEAEVEAARKEREQWANAVVSGSSTNTPSETPIAQTNALANIRLAHALLLEEHGSTLALVRQHESQVASLQATVDKLTQESLQLHADSMFLKDSLATKQKKWEAGEREIGFLRALLASHTAESALQDGHPLLQVDDRVEHLEALLAEFKQINTELETDIAARGPVTKESWDNLKQQIAMLDSEKSAVELDLKTTREALSKQEEEVESLSQQLFNLSGEIAGGRHLPPGVRVLSLRDNPASQWADTREAVLNQLRSENEALLRRLAEVGARSTSMALAEDTVTEGMVPRESWELVRREKQELEEVVKQKEKRLLRLQQIFTSKSAEFREAVASVLGLKLAFFPNGQVKVTSVFDLCASFVFQPMGDAGSGGMKMQLVAQGEGGPPELPQLMRYWIEEEECIPGFLASVTLECWDKMKRDKVNESAGNESFSS